MRSPLAAAGPCGLIRTVEAAREAFGPHEVLSGVLSEVLSAVVS
jgi:hypothetical protein